MEAGHIVLECYSSNVMRQKRIIVSTSTSIISVQGDNKY
jgi:hypothetical protein